MRNGSVVDCSVPVRARLATSVPFKYRRIVEPFQVTATWFHWLTVIVVGEAK